MDRLLNGRDEDAGAATRLDLRGLKCPLPVLRTRKRLRAMKEGAILSVSCTDPLAAIDIPNLVRELRCDLLAAGADGGVLVFRIRKGD